MKLAWLRREPPLPPAVVVTEGEAARRLLRKLAAQRASALQDLMGVAATPLLVAIRGPADTLPWIDGARYFGEATGAPGVFVPTTRRPGLTTRVPKAGPRPSAEREDASSSAPGHDDLLAAGGPPHPAPGAAGRFGGPRASHAAPPRDAPALPLIVQALRRRVPDGPLVWLPDGRIIPLATARPLDAATLLAWSER